MLTKLNALRDREEGFTLIELLVVVIIIGILAAIALPIFINQQKSAVDASVQSDVRNTVTNITSAQGSAAATAKLAKSRSETSVKVFENGATSALVETNGAVATTPLGTPYTVEGKNVNGLKYANNVYRFNSSTGSFTAQSETIPDVTLYSYDFESGVQGWDWYTYATTGTIAGRNALHVSRTGTGSFIYGPNNAPTFTPNTKYRFEGWVYIVAPTTLPQDASFLMYFGDGAAGGASTRVTGSWQKLSSTFSTGPVANATTRPGFNLFSSANGPIDYYLDDVSLTKLG